VSRHGSSSLHVLPRATVLSANTRIPFRAHVPVFEEGGPPLVECMVVVWWLHGGGVVVLKARAVLRVDDHAVALDDHARDRRLH
jgi:hypothetical protein